MEFNIARRTLPAYPPTTRLADTTSHVPPASFLRLPHLPALLHTCHLSTWDAYSLATLCWLLDGPHATCLAAALTVPPLLAHLVQIPVTPAFHAFLENVNRCVASYPLSSILCHGPHSARRLPHATAGAPPITHLGRGAS